MEEKFKPFWVCSVNNWLVGAAYSGKQLKANHIMPSFRKFYFIRSMDELKHFTPHKQITNEELVKRELERNANQLNQKNGTENN